MLEQVFLSTPPSRVATHGLGPAQRTATCFYPRHPRGWRRMPSPCCRKKLCFYPRHPRGWRRGVSTLDTPYYCVSIHATLAGGDGMSLSSSVSGATFLSTPPSRVATVSVPRPETPAPCFYPRHPRGWRPQRSATPFSRSAFLSTPPSRVATAAPGKLFKSIFRFYPRHPRGWRPQVMRGLTAYCTFLSTPPSRVATRLRRCPPRPAKVSIHATLAGGDGYCRKSTTGQREGFYPRHPRGWRRHT